MKTLATLIIGVLASVTLYAEASDRFIKKVKLPSGQTTVVAEGAFEARSVGSFSVRLYEAAPPEDETTFFTAGLIRGRDGTIDKVVLADIDDNQKPDIIVIVRSVGTGSYLSARAFSFDKVKLIFLAAVEGLPPDTDPVKALRISRRKGK
jgi:hypothetical protein